MQLSVPYPFRPVKLRLEPPAGVKQKAGANIAGFVKVADAMIDQGAV